MSLFKNISKNITKALMYSVLVIFSIAVIMIVAIISFMSVSDYYSYQQCIENGNNKEFCLKTIS